MTLAEFREAKRPTPEEQAAAQRAQEAAARHERPHPTPLQYVKIGVALAFVTAVEVAIFYTDLSQGVLIALLLALSAVKFILVAMWFMHLRFDNRLFSGLFVGGLALAGAIFIVVLATLGAGLV